MFILITSIISLILMIFYLFYFLLVWINSKKNNFVNNDHDTYFPLVSIIIPTYNEEITIENKLENILDQTYPNLDIHIIDSASIDNTVDKINKFKKENKVDLNFIIEEERRGKAYALNKTFKECKGEIIAITDADALWKNDAVENMIINFTNNKIGAVTGKQIVVERNINYITENEKAYKNIFDVLRKGESNLDSTMIFNGPAMAFRSDLIEPLPEDTIADDSYLAMMIRKKGYKTIFDETFVFYESVPGGKNFLNQKIRRGQGLIQAFLRNLEFLFNPKYGLYGMVLFPAEFFMHIISPLICLTIFILGLIIMINEGWYLYGIIITISTFLVYRLKLFSIDKVIFSFLEYQFILLLSLLSHTLGIKQHKWNILERDTLEINEGE